MEEKLNKALALRQLGKLKKSNQLMVQLAKTYPFYASINYECGQSLMLIGQKGEAAPYFEQAIRLGLPSKTLVNTYVCLFHSYREMGEMERAREVIEKGYETFPDHAELEKLYHTKRSEVVMDKELV